MQQPRVHEVSFPQEANQSQSFPPPAPVARGGDTLDVRDLFLSLARGWWVLVIFAGIGLYQGYKSLQNFSPVYEATLVVAPGTGGHQSSGALSEVSRSLGIQVTMPTAEASTFDRLRLLLGSPQFIEYLDQRHAFMNRVFGDSQDPMTGEWKKPTGRRFEIEQQVRRALHLPTWRAPSLESLTEYLKSAIVFTRKLDQPAFFTIAFSHRDAEMARWLLQTVYFEGDDFLRQEDRQKTQQRIAYLRQQLNVQNLDFRAMFLNMLAEQERNLMLLSSDTPYAAEIAQPVHVTSVPSAPNMVRDFGVIVAGWILTGALLVLFIELIRRPRT